MFNRENPQNSEPQNGPRSGLDYIALEISTLLKTITNSCFQALEGLKFQALEGLKFQDKQTQRQMIQI